MPCPVRYLSVAARTTVPNAAKPADQIKQNFISIESFYKQEVRAALHLDCLNVHTSLLFIINLEQMCLCLHDLNPPKKKEV